ncbi:MAG: ABC transporter permease [Synechococcales bacterium]|nr:ABC transporter permease [Synechococcales bacterium]
MYLRIPPPSSSPQGTRFRQRRQYIYYRDLLWELVVRELKLLYKRSIFGVAWTLMNPLLQLAIFSLVFRLILKAGGDIPHYLAYAFSGILIWTWTQSSLFQATALITGNRPLIRQPSFPVPILPVVTTTTGLIHFLLAIPALLVIMLIDGVHYDLKILLIPIPLILQFLLTVSIAYPLAALNVTFRDTQHTLGVILQLMFYLLPIFYSIDLITANSDVSFWLKELYLLNPLVTILELYRYVFSITPNLPDLWHLISLAIACMFLLPLGYRIFRKQSERFVEEL